MEKECGKYILKSDSMNLWIEEKYEIKKGKSAGQIASRVITGYHRDFAHLFDSFVMNKIRGSEAENMKQLLQDIKEAESDLRDLAVKLGGELDGHIHNLRKATGQGKSKDIL